MRSGGCTVQQAFSPEAAGVLKMAVGIARRRGHAQVTPLHIASAMLSSPEGMLRAACRKAHSHPLQCKALELCFNVALNRLPASSAPILGHAPHHLPAFANALVAAFKRAQAHQRRGGAESPQPVLAVKIELGQLTISILDDPSISRVMREAGFSSTQVKCNVERAISSAHPNPSSLSAISTTTTTTTANPSTSKPMEEDVATVTSALVRRRKKKGVVVMVSESLPMVEGVVKALMERVERGEVEEPLKGAEFVTLPSQTGREEVEKWVNNVKGLGRGRGVVVYIGDLSWVTSNSWEALPPLQLLIMEIGRMVCSNMERLWLLGVAGYSTYMKCKDGSPSIDALWSLHPLPLPAGSLALSLSCESGPSSMSKMRGNISGDGCCRSSYSMSEIGGVEDCGAHCSIKSPQSNSSTLPSWLRQYKENSSKDKECLHIKDLCNRWNSVDSPSFSCLLPSCFEAHHPPVINHWAFQAVDNSNPNPSFGSSSTEAMEIEYQHRYKELSAENLRTLCDSLERKAPWQREIIPEIATTVLRCRSGLVMRREKPLASAATKKEDTWLFFHGCDVHGKERIQRELASVVFGSSTRVVSIRNQASTRSDSDEITISGEGYLERIAGAVRDDAHRVIVLEDVEQLDQKSRWEIKKAIDGGVLRGSCGEEIMFSDAILVLSCESFDSRSRASSPPAKDEGEREEDDKVFLDLNVCVEDEEVCSLDGDGLIEAVDKAFFFKLPEDLSC